ncbi:MAG: hypothetical protein ABIQ40_14830 [Bacteroidia bacterium]
MKRSISLRPSPNIRIHLLILFLVATSFIQAQNVTTQKTVLRKVEWMSGIHKFSDVLIFNYSDYSYYKSLPKKQRPYSRFAADYDSHSYLLEMAKVLDADAEAFNLSRREIGQCIIDFVQQAIPYKADPENNGYDYPKYPIETIIENGGDCEDKAALLVALLNTFGFDAVLIQFKDHMGVGIKQEESKGTYYAYNEKKYYYVESTAPYWKVGVLPEEYKTAAIVMAAPQVKVYSRGVAESSTVTSASNGESGKAHPADKMPELKTESPGTIPETRPTIINAGVRRR